MKHLLFLIFPLWLFSAEPDKKLHEKSLYPTIKLSYNRNHCDCDECTKKPQQAVASGFIVKSEKTNSNLIDDKYVNVIVTAAHNVENVISSVDIHVGIYENWSNLQKFDTYQSFVFAINKKMDLAVLIFKSDKKMPCVDMEIDNSPYFGTDVFKIGYGLGDDIRIDYGTITSVDTKKPENLKGFLRSNCYTIFGDSGGPLFYKDGYKVMGVTSSIRGSDTFFLNNQSYFTPIYWIKNWNDELEGNLSFIYKENKKIPQTLLYQLWLRDFEVKGTRK